MAPRVADRWEVPSPGDGPVPETAGDRTGSLRPGVGEWLARRLRLAPAQVKALAYLVAAAAVGIALMGLPDPSRSPPERGGRSVPAPAGGGRNLPAAALNPPVPPEPGEARVDLERELEAMLNLMEGVGSVKVFITYERGPEQVVAFNETREERVTAGADGARPGPGGVERRSVRQAVLVRDADGRRELPVVLLERYPAIRGVMVVADGARNPAVRLAIQRAVAGALGVSPHRVVVGTKRR